LKDTLNCALAFIFDDREFEVDISLNDKRGKSLTLIIYNQGNPVSLKDGMGMGVNCAISAILQIYYLCCKSSKILCLDEAYHNVAHEYLPRFFDFISKLCKSLGFTLALITHDERAIVFADKLYKVHRGVIKGDTVE
jgi:ABC-type nitrate/sulfonate/bicarbonate transport system ATPase subunit